MRKDAKILKEYHEEELGLPYAITLENSVLAEFDEKGNIESVAIPAFESFIATFIMLRIQVANRFRPEEIKFFRKAMHLKGKELAEKLATTAETISRWENKGKLKEPNERLLRILLAKHFKGQAPSMKVKIETLLQMGLKAPFEDDYQPKFVFSCKAKVQEGEKSWDGLEIKSAA